MMEAALEQMIGMFFGSDEIVEEPAGPDTGSIIDNVLDKLSSIRADCEDWHEYIDHNRRQYLLDHHEDDNIYNITLAKPHNVVTYSKGVLMGAEYHMEAIAFRETDDMIAAQSAYEKFALALWDTNDERQPWPVREEFITAQLVDGSGWMRIYVDSDYMPPGPTQAWNQNPITFEVVDALDVYPKLASNPRQMFEYVITLHQESLFDLKQQWPDKDWSEHEASYDDNGRELSEREHYVDVYQYTGYDAQENVVQTICTDKVVLADEVLWHSSQNPHLPWAVAACYSGRAPKDAGAAMSLKARFQSVLHPIDDDVITAEHIASADMRGLDMFGNMPPVVRTREGRHVDIDPAWGNVVQLGLDESLEFPRWPGNPPDSTRLTSLVLADMQEASFSAAAMGYAGSSASGYQVSLTTESSRTRLYLPGRAFAKVIRDAAAMSVHLLNLYMPQTMLHLYGMGANGQYSAFGFHPAMAQGLHLRCDIKLTMPGDDVKKTGIATQWLAMGMPMETVLSDVLDYKQPDDIMRKMKKEKAESHPLVMLLGMAQALQESNSPYLPIIMQAVGQTAQGMMQGISGPTGGPGMNQPNAQMPGQQPTPGPMGQDVLPMTQQQPQVPGMQGMMPPGSPPPTMGPGMPPM